MTTNDGQKYEEQAGVITGNPLRVGVTKTPDGAVHRDAGRHAPSGPSEHKTSPRRLCRGRQITIAVSARAYIMRIQSARGDPPHEALTGAAARRGYDTGISRAGHQGMGGRVHARRAISSEALVFAGRDEIVGAVLII